MPPRELDARVAIVLPALFSRDVCTPGARPLT